MIYTGRDKTKITRPRLCMILVGIQAYAHCGKCSDRQMDGRLFMNIKLLHASDSFHANFKINTSSVLEHLGGFLGIKWHSRVLQRTFKNQESPHHKHTQKQRWLIRFKQGSNTAKAINHTKRSYFLVAIQSCSQTNIVYEAESSLNQYKIVVTTVSKTLVY